MRDLIEAAAAVRDRFMSVQGRPPSPAELAGELGVGVDDLAMIERAIRFATAGHAVELVEARLPAPDRRAESDDEVGSILREFPPSSRAMLVASAEGTARQADVAARFGMSGSRWDRW